MDLRILLCLALNVLRIYGDHVAIIAPYISYKDQDYKVFLSTSEITEDTTVVVKFRGQQTAIFFRDGTEIRRNNAIVFSRDYRKKSLGFLTVDKDHGVGFNLSVFIHKDGECSRKTVAIESLSKKCFVFIQMDKPVYEPNDTVKFRVILLDRETKIFHADMIEVQVFDAKGQHVLSLRDIRNYQNGVFEDKFSIGEEVNKGNWTMKVIVNGRKYDQTGKSFLVGKPSLNMLEVFIEVPKIVFVGEEEFDIRISAKNSSGAYVNREAQLTIRSSNTHQVLKQESINISCFSTRTINLQSDLQFTQLTNTSIDIEVKMTDSAGEVEASNSKTVKVEGRKKYKLELSYPFPYIPGLTFQIYATITSYNGSVIHNSFEFARLLVYYGDGNFLARDSDIKNGKASFAIKFARSVKSFDLKVEYLDIVVTDKIQANEFSPGSDLHVFLVPETVEYHNYSIGSYLWLNVNSDVELGTIIVLFINRLGIVYYGTHDCEGEKSAEVAIRITERMMPAVDIHVYNFESTSEEFIKGQLTVKFDRIEDNHMDLHNPHKLKLIEEVAASREKYETLHQSVLFDGTNYILKFDLDDTGDCSREDLMEVRRIQGPTWPLRSYDDDVGAVEVKVENPPGLGRSFSRILEKLHDSRNVVTNLANIWKHLPDFTSWTMSAFSINSNHSFALTDLKELVVSKEFSVKFGEPYWIKIGEILKVDIEALDVLDRGNSITADITFSTRAPNGVE